MLLWSLTSAVRVDAGGRRDPGEVAFVTFRNRVAMMPEENLSLASQIRDKLDAGVLPRVLPEKMWTGYGHGNPCGGCSQLIRPAQIEYHFPPGLRRRVAASHRLLGDVAGRAAAPR